MFPRKPTSASRWLIACAVIAFGARLNPHASASSPENASWIPAAEADNPDAAKDKTDAFGDPLPPGVAARLGSGRLRHAGPVMRLAFTASGKLASTGYDTTVRLWDGQSGEELLRLEAGNTIVQGLAVTGDEKLLAAGGDAVYVWETRTGKQLHRLQGSKALTYAVAFSPDGTRLVSADGDHVFRLWDTASGKIVRTFAAEETFIPPIAFSPDGKMLATGHGRNVWLWDVDNGKKLRQLRGHTKNVYALTFTPDGATLASGSEDRTIRLWDPATADLVRTLEGHTHQVLSAAFSPDGKKFASAGGDNLVRVWEVASGKESLQIRQGLGERDSNVNCVAFSPDGATLAAGSNHDRIRIWDAATGKEKQPPRGHEGSVTSLAFTADGKRLFSGCFAGAVIGWDPATGKELRTYARDGMRVFALVASPDGETLAAGYDGSTRIWKTATGQEILTLRSGLSTRVAFLPRGQVLTSDGSRQSQVWDLRTGKSVAEAPPAMLVTPNSNILHQKDNSLFLHDPNVRKDVVEFKLPVPKPPPRDDLKGQLLFNVVGVNCAAVSPDGKTLATSSQAHLTNKGEGFGAIGFTYEENIHLWDVFTGKLRSTIALPFVSWGAHGRIECLAFSPDGRTLAGGGRTAGNQPVKHARVLFWDVASGKEIHEIQIPRLAGENPVACLAFSPDGKTLATGGCDTTVMVWRLPGAIAARAAKR